jgi:uncharacterized protein
MKCPNCNKPMRELSTKSKYGANILIDQCSDCGGLWFDDVEMYTVKEDAAKLIDQIDSQKLNKNTSINEEMFCPRDGVKLKLFKDINFPDHIKIESCPKCRGFFFNKGEFANFSDRRHKRIKELSQREESNFEKQVEKFFNTSSQSSKYDMLGDIGKFLSQNPNGPPPEYSNANSKKYASIASAVIYIIYRLFRLLVFKK